MSAESVVSVVSSDRTKEERQAQVRPILEKLSELKLYASKFAPVKMLMLQIKDYVANGEAQQINIVFPEFGRRIKGTLETNRWVESSIKMTEIVWKNQIINDVSTQIKCALYYYNIVIPDVIQQKVVHHIWRSNPKLS